MPALEADRKVSERNLPRTFASYPGCVTVYRYHGLPGHVVLELSTGGHDGCMDVALVGGFGLFG